MKMKSFSSSSRWLLLVVGLLGGCATAAPPQKDVSFQAPIAIDNQAGIWVAGRTLYEKGRFLAAADLFQMAYKLKPARRITQNIGMAYFKAAQLPEHPDVLRLEYVHRALPCLRNYRSWLVNDFGRTHDVAAALAETDQHIAAALQLEKELNAAVDPSRDVAVAELQAAGR